jgi:hydrogenase nickel insertion protein HypA
MHEATIASNILDVIATRVAQHPHTRARSITVLIGAFRNVDEESLCFAFDALKEDYPGCARCQLIVESTSLLAHCVEHHHLYQPHPEQLYRCECGSGMGDIVRGQELDVLQCTLQAADEESLCTK